MIASHRQAEQTPCPHDIYQTAYDPPGDVKLHHGFRTYEIIYVRPMLVIQLHNEMNVVWYSDVLIVHCFAYYHSIFIDSTNDDLQCPCISL